FYHSGTYGHRKFSASHPVRSGLYKQFTGGLVVRWVTTSESPLPYVFGFILELRFWRILQESRDWLLACGYVRYKAPGANVRQ
ncbi:hypothetical protein COCHEDRAFT_1119423, partial [Bipolaris maydis C5]